MCMTKQRHTTNERCHYWQTTCGWAWLQSSVIESKKCVSEHRWLLLHRKLPSIKSDVARWTRLCVWNLVCLILHVRLLGGSKAPPDKSYSCCYSYRLGGRYSGNYALEHKSRTEKLFFKCKILAPWMTIIASEPMMCIPTQRRSNLARRR